MEETRKTKRFVIVKKDYPHHETLRGQVGVLTSHYEDGTVCVHFEDGPHKGDRVCLGREYVELLS